MLVTSQPTTDEPGAGDPVVVDEPVSGAPGPRWARPGFALLLAATAVAYLWNLSASGNANSFYAAAVEAGTKSWKAMFFGSLDSSNFITVDKPPASLWVMDLSGRIFGFSSWSMLVPEALMGVAAVALVYLTIKRWFGPAAGLVAGATLAMTPVAALMFRFNNPDAFLVLLMVGAAYALTRALEGAKTRWIVAVGALLGFAFLAKMLQAFCVLPGFALVYLIASPTTLRRRIVQLLIGGAAIVVAAGWWVAIVALTPASSRPFIDGSSDNSIINLILGYNGLGRLTGASSGAPGGGGAPSGAKLSGGAAHLAGRAGGGGGGGGGSFSGTPGVFRLFNDLMGGQASWVLPLALVVLVVGVLACGRKVRTDRTRAALLLWGSWLVVTGVVFSFGKGIIHTYYTVALAPAIAALVGIGASMLWTHRHRLLARAVAAAAIVGTAVWAFVLLDRTPTYHPWIRWAALLGAIVAAAALVAGELIPRLGRRITLGAVALGLTAVLAGPLAFTLSTVDTAHTGSVPSAGPATASAFGGMGGGSRPGGQGGAGGFPGGSSGGPPGAGGGSASGSSASGPSGSTAFGGPPSAPSGATGSGGSTSGGPGGGGGSAGGMDGGTTSSALVKALEADAKDYRWVAATSGSQSAATLELSTGGDPVMAIGGFSGSGGNLSLATFESYVAKGDIHYYIASSGGPGGGNSTSAITSWVKSHAKAETIGGETVYDLSSLKTS